MNKIKTASLLGALYAVLLPAQLLAKERITLLDEKFENPKGQFCNYPPSPGEKFVFMVKDGDITVAAWGQGTQTTLTYSPGIGTKDSGGMDCKLTKSAGGLYAQVSVSGINFPDVDPTVGLTAEKLGSLKFSFAAKIPDGEELGISIAPNLPKDGPDESFPNRIVFPSIKGTGNYETYEFSVADLPEAKVEGFLNVIKKAMAAGLPKAGGSIGLTFSKNFPEGSSFQLDDFLITVEN